MTSEAKIMFLMGTLVLIIYLLSFGVGYWFTRGALKAKREEEE